MYSSTWICSSEQVDLYCFQDCQEWSEKQLKWTRNFSSLFTRLDCVALWNWQTQRSPAELGWHIPGRGHSVAEQAWVVMLELLEVRSRLVSSGLGVPLSLVVFRKQTPDPCPPDPNTFWCFFFAKRLNLCIHGQFENGRTKEREGASCPLYLLFIAGRPLDIYRKFQLPTLLWMFLHVYISNTCSACWKTPFLVFFHSATWAEKTYLATECFLLF